MFLPLQVLINIFLGGGQNLEPRNVERLIFRNFEIANIKMTIDELFDNFSSCEIFIFQMIELNFFHFPNC